MDLYFYGKSEFFRNFSKFSSFIQHFQLKMGHNCDKIKTKVLLMTKYLFFLFTYFQQKFHMRYKKEYRINFLLLINHCIQHSNQNRPISLANFYQEKYFQVLSLYA